MTIPLHGDDGDTLHGGKDLIGDGGVQLARSFVVTWPMTRTFVARVAAWQLAGRSTGMPCIVIAPKVSHAVVESGVPVAHVLVA